MVPKIHKKTNLKITKEHFGYFFFEVLVLAFPNTIGAKYQKTEETRIEQRSFLYTRCGRTKRVVELLSNGLYYQRNTYTVQEIKMIQGYHYLLWGITCWGTLDLCQLSCADKVGQLHSN